MSPASYVRSPAVLWRNVGAEVLLAAPDRDDVDVLSVTAGDVWRLLDRPRKVSDLAEALGEVYQGPGDRIAGDVNRLLLDLVERGWVDEADASHR